MNFTTEELVEALRNRLTANGKKLALSERTLKANVERLYKRLEKTDEETALEDIVTEYLPDYEELEGNYRKDNADFIKKWKEEHPETKPDPKPKEEPTDGDSQMPAWAKALVESNRKLQARFDAEDAAKATGEKRRQLEAAMKAKGVSEKLINGYMQVASVNPDTDIDAETDKAVTWANALESHIKPSPTPGATNSKTTDMEHEFDDVKAAMENV